MNSNLLLVLFLVGGFILEKTHASCAVKLEPGPRSGSQRPLRSLERTQFSKAEVDELGLLAALPPAHLYAALKTKSAKDILKLRVRADLLELFSRWTFWKGSLFAKTIRARKLDVSVLSSVVPVHKDNLDGLKLLPDVSGLSERIELFMAESLSPAERREVAKVIFKEAASVGWLLNDSFIDRILGLRSLEISEQESSSSLHLKDPYAYWGAPPDALLTPYSTISKIMRYFAPREGQTVIDLGTAFGRPGIFLGIMKPGVKFVGYEFLKDRVSEGQRVVESLGLSNNIHLVKKDLNDPDLDLSAGDHFFIYNGFSEQLEQKIMSDLERLSKHKQIRVLHWRNSSSEGVFKSRYPWLRRVSPYFADTIYHDFAVYESFTP